MQASAAQVTPDHATDVDPNAGKFRNPDVTLKGETRASVPFVRLDTLWINTGSLCNITCANCYIESSPSNDRLAYITTAEVMPLLDEAKALGTREIGFTGGEPFLNRDLPAMLEETLSRGFEALVLTNAMRPMQRPRVSESLIGLDRRYPGQITLRVSLDHFTRVLHEKERGEATWEPAIEGIDWLDANGLRYTIAGRTCWGESEAEARAGYARLFAERGWRIDAANGAELILFPEMDGKSNVPEITTACWGILHKRPVDMMCATSRMVVKRREAAAPVVLPCTLLPYDPAFEMGTTLAQAAAADGGMFTKGGVKLCHSHCAKFCVLGGGSCS